MAYAFVLLVGLAAGALSGIIGTGSSIMLLPILVYQFGPKQAVPIMAVAAVMSNIAKVMAWWREVDWRAFAAYTIPGVPAWEREMTEWLNARLHHKGPIGEGIRARAPTPGT